MFFAAMNDIGAAKNVVSVTQTTAGVTEKPDCAAEGFTCARKKFVGIASRFVFSEPKPGSGADTNSEVIHSNAGLAALNLSRPGKFVRFATRFVAAVPRIFAVIGTFPAFSQWFLLRSNKFLFVTEKNLKIGPAGNALILIGLGRAGEELFDDGEELFDDEEELLDAGEEFPDDGKELLHDGVECLRHRVEPD
jgi:hypothetical protein